ncbi:tetratricopeptide repeat protein [Paludibaculum fermentans]|uniref:tetratricopeptide repeat protein n=1 Tax=Paludibaculum fermentans TaxID=1473598 RepID=UPI003EBF46F8
MAERLARRVVLVGWSAADWKVLNPLLDAGELPALQSLVEQGVKGDLASLSPMLSPLLWTSIVTGHTPDRHRVLGPFEPDEATGAARLASSTARQVKALWNLLAQSGLRSLAVNWFASQPAESVAGVVISNLYPKARAAYGQPWALPGGCIQPRSLSDTLSEYRIHAGDLTGDDLKAFIPALERVDQVSDTRPLTLAIALAEALSVHGAATWLMENETWDLLAVHYSSLDAVCRTFMPFHPPRREHVSEGDFEIYQAVVERVYCYHDALLGRLIALAGPDAAIVLVSENGFHSDGLRPSGKPTLDDPASGWERGHGVFAAAGPGLRQDELVFGAGLLDVVPFVLQLFGLPAGQDMPGRILPDAFVNPPDDVRIPTWEAAPVEEPKDEWDRAGALAELAELGYVEPGRTAEFERVTAQNEGTLAHVHMAANRFAEGIPLLERVITVQPSATARLALAHCYQMVGRLDEARTAVDAVLTEDPHRSHGWLIRANLALAAGETGAALELLTEAGRRGAGNAQLQHRMGLVYERLGRWSDAEECQARALELDPQFQPACMSRARALLELKRNAEAASMALDAVNLRYDDHAAHLLLGVALAQEGQAERAIQALETSVRYRPTSAAHRWLAFLSEKAIVNPQKARFHRKRAAELAAKP